MEGHNNDAGSSYSPLQSSANGFGEECPQSDEAGPSYEAARRRIKNLDTGEEYDIDTFDARAYPFGGQHTVTEAELPGAVADETKGKGLGKKGKVLLKGTKRLKTWAKTTLSNVRERVEERLEKHHLERQLHHQQQQQQKLQQQRKQPQKSESRLSFGSNFSGGLPAEEAGSAEHQHGQLPSTQSLGSWGPGAAEGDAGGHDARAGAEDMRGSGPLSTNGSGGFTLLQPRRNRSGGGSRPSSRGSGSVFDDIPPPPVSTSAFEGETEYSGGGVRGANLHVVSPLSIEGERYVAQLPLSPAVAVTATYGSGVHSHVRPTAAAATQPSSSVAPSTSVFPQAVQSIGAASGSTRRLSSGSCASTATTSAAVCTTAVGILAPPLGSGSAAAVSLLMSQQTGISSVPSEELRIPLLDEDVAGPSSRAVPTTKSWLNQPARVAGGRRSGGRQLQQVRMIQEVLGHEGVVWAMKFSADARLLATAGRDGAVRVWAVYWTASGRSKLISLSRDRATGGPPPSDIPVPPSTRTSLSTKPPPSVAPSTHSFTPSTAAATHARGSASTIPETPLNHPGAPAAAAGAATRPQLISESPLVVLSGHRADVLDLAWSQCRLLLSASADQTARLWHVEGPGGASGGSGGGGGGGGSQGGVGGGMEGGEGYGHGHGGHRPWQGGGVGGWKTAAEGSWESVGSSSGGGGGGGGGYSVGECLRVFWHPDFVTSCCFHPSDPRRIVTGCVDGKIRVWSVPDGSVLSTATVQQDIITRVLVNSEGCRVVAATLRGKAVLYEHSPTGGLEHMGNIDVKNQHGSGRKVTGLIEVPKYDTASGGGSGAGGVGSVTNDQLYVITSADSRIRMYRGYTQERKFKGHLHNNTQISAALSPNCQHLACGSDDGWVYIWETGLPPYVPATPRHLISPTGGVPVGGMAGAAAGNAAASTAAATSGKAKERCYEAFQTPEGTTTVVLFAPNICRLGRGPERLGGAIGASGTTGASPLLGALWVVAGFSGRIYVYENLPL